MGKTSAFDSILSCH